MTKYNYTISIPVGCLSNAHLDTSYLGAAGLADWFVDSDGTSPVYLTQIIVEPSGDASDANPKISLSPVAAIPLHGVSPALIIKSDLSGPDLPVAFSSWTGRWIDTGGSSWVMQRRYRQNRELWTSEGYVQAFSMSYPTSVFWESGRRNGAVTPLVCRPGKGWALTHQDPSSTTSLLYSVMSTVYQDI